MNPEDSQITALLDDELDPGDRTAVAWAVEASSPAAQHLADLRSAHNLVRDLDRPAIPVDLSGAILARIAPAARPRRRQPRLAAARFAASLVGVASVAASLMFAVILLHKTLHETPKADPILFGTATPRRNHPFDQSIQPMSPAAEVTADRSDQFASRAQSQPARIGATQPTEERLVAAFAPVARAAKTRAVLPSLAKPVAARIVTEPDPTRPEQVDVILANRTVVRALIVTEVFDRDARQVQDLIQRDPARDPEFGRIALPPGLVVDPDQPGEAEVYPVAVARGEVGPFLDRLRGAFPRLAVEQDPEPALVAHLGEVGRVTLLGDEGHARLGIAPRNIPLHIAVKGGPPEDILAIADQLTGRADNPGMLVFARERQKPETALPDQPPGGQANVKARDKAKAAAKLDDESVTVLVWVVRSTR